MCLAFDLEDLDGLVRGACCKPSAVVVEHSVMLVWQYVSFKSNGLRTRRRVFDERTIMSS